MPEIFAPKAEITRFETRKIFFLLFCPRFTYSEIPVTIAPDPLHLPGLPWVAKEKPGWKVVYFWSTSCPCVRRCEEATLFPLFHKYQNKGVRFYAIAANAANVRYGSMAATSGSESQTNTEKATLSLPGPLEKNETPPYPIVVDNHHRFANDLQATHTPETFLIDPRGRIIFHGDPDVPSGQ
jgi:hypothetical protein